MSLIIRVDKAEMLTDFELKTAIDHDACDDVLVREITIEDTSICADELATKNPDMCSTVRVGE